MHALFLRFSAVALLLAVPTQAQTGSELDRFAGYFRAGTEVVRIWRDEDRLYAQGSGQPRIEIRRSGPDRFIGGPNHPYAYAFARSPAGRITGLRFEAHGEEKWWPRLSEREARTVAAREAANLARRAPHPGVEATLRRHILAVEQGAPLYDEMGPGLAGGVRSGFPQVQKMLAGLGRFQTLTYKSTLASGADVFSARYENGSLEWVIEPPGRDGKIYHLAFSFERKP